MWPVLPGQAPPPRATGQGAPQKTGRSLHLEALALSRKRGGEGGPLIAVSRGPARRDQAWSLLLQRWPASHPGAHTAEAPPRRHDQEATGGRGLAPSCSRGPHTSRCGSYKSWTERRRTAHPCARSCAHRHGTRGSRKGLCCLSLCGARLLKAHSEPLLSLRCTCEGSRVSGVCVSDTVADSPTHLCPVGTPAPPCVHRPLTPGAPGRPRPRLQTGVQGRPQSRAGTRSGWACCQEEVRS